MSAAGKEGNDLIEKERCFHGSAWMDAHGGYFSDPDIARPLIDDFCQAPGNGNVGTVADIGGGTGVVLCQLRARLRRPGVRFVNVDASTAQLEACAHEDIERVCASALELRREMLCRPGIHMALISRSLLHYFGKEGQSRFLLRMRDLLQVGEVFIHQPAAFDTPQLTECMNVLYPMMGVEKWYATPRELEDLHRDNGWEVVRSREGPPLDLRSEDLARRYHLTDVRIEEMVEVIRGYGLEEVFRLRPDGFRTDFTYRILTLRAV